jgi:N-acyl-D-amino-acid deacylase
MLVLAGGTLVDGSGAAPVRADVGIEGDHIVAVAPSLDGDERIDCRGHVVAPGFLDTHSHSDVKVLADPLLPMKLRQGITLEVFGQDGISVAPVRAAERDTWRQKLTGLLGDFGVVWDWESVGEYLGRVAATGPACDFAYLVPHGAIRQVVVGGDDRKAELHEILAMQELLRESFRTGGCGLSTGLIYPPCCYADTAELIALGRVLCETGKPLVVHMRSESDHIEDGLDEMLEVARISGCAVHLSHFKIAGRQNWHRMPALLAMVEAARAEGLRITADQYPYAAGSTLLGAILPPWAHAGGTDVTLLRLGDPAARQRMREQMSETAACSWDNFWKWSGPEGILVTDVPSGHHPEYVGKSLAEVARIRGEDPFEASFGLLLEERMGVAMVSFSQSEPEVERVLAQPWVNTCTDGLLGGRPHPRAFGSYPRILGRFVRERGVIALPEAIRKMTSQAAAAFGFRDVGLVRPGYRANLVVFDPEAVLDLATFEEPLQFPRGVRDVIVSGQPVLQDGEMTGQRPGRLVTSSEPGRNTTWPS